MDVNAEVNNLISKAFSLVNEDKNNEAFEIVNAISSDKYVNNLNKDHFQAIGDICLSLGKFELAKDFYLKAENPEAASLALIALDDLDEASKLLLKCPKSPPSTWCNFLIDVFNEKAIKQWPSFLEIRHFMELTVYSLLLGKRHYFISLLLKRLNRLLDINIDSEKLIGYAYFHYGDLDNAIKFLKSSIRKNRTDGEIYFVLGQISLEKGDLKESLSMLENAKTLLANHYPSKKLYEEVKAALSLRTLKG
jgi:tetratricopeptide (TPR) repeat protein